MKQSLKQSLPLSKIHIDDQFWNQYISLIPKKMIPYQWEILNDRVKDAAPSYCLRNFRIAAGEEEGRHRGMVFQDSDAAKWLEAVAYSLAISPDPDLEKNADELIALVGRAQENDGYLNTYFTLNEPDNKWKNLTEGHELYCAGHFIEAAVAYFETTGKKAFLDIVCRLADHICKVFGPEEGQCHGYPGHPEIELALVRLYHVTGVKHYLETAKYFVDVRGGKPNYFAEEIKKPDFKPIFSHLERIDPGYFQSHVPVREQDTAEGHSVRALYLYCAMADLAEEYNDNDLLKSCCLLWENIVQKRMYITGGVGSSAYLERFTTDYDLPNDSNYSETCASIALAMFGLRMARITKHASYFDTVERALYNTVTAGISLEGDRYFYVNPLEVWPDACMDFTSRSHVKPLRQKWFDCACCPTNVARTFTSLGSYIYFFHKKDDTNELFLNLFIQNKACFDIDGKPVSISVITDYPKSGFVKIAVRSEAAPFAINVRIPDFADDFKVLLNGNNVNGEIKNNYFSVSNITNNDEITVSFTLKPLIVFANPRVHQNCGKAAIARGPEVFCFEEIDNGLNLAALSLDTEAALEESWQDDTLGGFMMIKARGKRLVEPALPESFSSKFIPQTLDAELKALPYSYWGKRTPDKPGEMIVWLRAY